MADELKHKDVGTSLTELEWTGIDSHLLDGQAIGDTIYALSTVQLSRLGIGATDEVLTVDSGVPSWKAITKVGTIGTGLWQGTEVGEVYGGTNQTSYTQGDLLYSSASNTLAKLALGNAGDQLKVNGAGTQVAWEAAGSAGASVGLAAALAIVF